MSCLSSKQSVYCDLKESLTEEFEYILNNSMPEFHHIFHLLIRRKTLLRLCPALDCKRDVDDFEEVEDVLDQYAFYQENFEALRFLHKNVDQEFFATATTRLRKMAVERVERKYNANPGVALELELFMAEFKLLIDTLADYYQRAHLYHLIERGNLKEFKQVDIDQKLRSVLMPLMVSKLVGRFGSVSSTVVRKLISLLLSRAAAVNFSCVELLLPDLCLFGENSRVAGYIAQFLSTRVFAREKEQLKFFLILINARIAELLAELSLCFRQLLDPPQPLGFSEFETRHEELNYKFEEINAMKLHASAEQLDFGTLCRLAPVEQRREGEEPPAGPQPSRKFSSDQESSAESEPALDGFFGEGGVGRALL